MSNANAHLRQAKSVLAKANPRTTPHHEALVAIANGVESLYDDMQDLSKTMNIRFDGIDTALQVLLERVPGNVEG